jgi:hypothetical protein
MQEGQDQNQSGWVFTPGGSPPPEAPAAAPVAEPNPAPVASPAGSNSGISWNASEYVTHQNGFSWYLMVILATVGLAAIIFFFTREWISSLVIIIMGIAFAAFSARQPRVQQYGVTDSGIQIGQKFYKFEQFKSFAVMHEGAMGFVSLLPLRRFLPPVAMYYAPDDEDKILDALSEHLPYEQRDHDAIDRLTRKIRF